MPNYKINPPSWQPNAVKSAQGWRHPETNELLVSIRLDGFENEPKPTKRKDKKGSNAKVAELLNVDEEVLDALTEEDAIEEEVVEEPVVEEVVVEEVAVEEVAEPVTEKQAAKSSKKSK